MRKRIVVFEGVHEQKESLMESIKDFLKKEYGLDVHIGGKYIELTLVDLMNGEYNAEEEGLIFIETKESLSYSNCNPLLIVHFGNGINNAVVKNRKNVMYINNKDKSLNVVAAVSGQLYELFKYRNIPEYIEQIYYLMNLPDCERNFICSFLWTREVREDVRQYINHSDEHKALTERDIDEIATSMVMDGEIDTDMPYQQIIDNLCNDIKEIEGGK